MYTYKILVTPLDEYSHDKALAEVKRYCLVRNAYMQHQQQWLECTPEKITDADRKRASVLADEPRTGRKPSKKTLVRCSTPFNEKARKMEAEYRLTEDAKLEEKLTDLKERWMNVEVVSSGLTRDLREELKAADARSLYKQFVDEGMYDQTYHLAQQAAAAAKHQIPVSELEGRAAINPAYIRWEDFGPDADQSVMVYARPAEGAREPDPKKFTYWRLNRNHLRRRPITAAQEEAVRAHDAKRVGMVPILHDSSRPPVDAPIRQAYLTYTRVSSKLLTYWRYEWHLCLVLDVKRPQRAVDKNRCAAGMDLCWRGSPNDNTLRVAYVANTRGEHWAVDMPKRAYQRMQHAESISTLADQDANKLRADLGLHPETSHIKILHAQWHRENPESTPDMNWRTHPIKNEIAQHMVHLVEWAHYDKRRAINHRNREYLREIHKILRAHHTIYIEDMKGSSQLVQKKSTREKKFGELSAEQAGRARDQRQAAAPFTAYLRILQSEAPKFSTEVVLVDPAFSSRLCIECGMDMGKSSELSRTCPHCKVRHYDIDRLAAINILGSGDPDAWRVWKRSA